MATLRRKNRRIPAETLDRCPQISNCDDKNCRKVHKNKAHHSVRGQGVVLLELLREVVMATAEPSCPRALAKWGFLRSQYLLSQTRLRGHSPTRYKSPTDHS